MNKYHSQFRVAEQRAVSPVPSDSCAAKMPKPPAIPLKVPAAKPRVLMVGMHLTKTRGGISTLISEILKSPLKDEFEFDYVESQAEDYGKLGKALLALRAVARFIFICLLKRPELVYVHLGSNASLYRESIFIFLAKVFGKKTLAHFHAGDIDNYYPFQSRAGRKFIRKAVAASDKVIAVSHESARQLQNIVTSAANISVVKNAINTADFIGSEVLSNIRRRRSDTVRLLFVGACGKLKGEKDLIEALAILREKRPLPNIKVSFLGYDAENLKDYCEELRVMDLVEHLGAVSMRERIDFFRKADIFVLPTYAEAMPMSVIEAMAAGLAVISTKVGGIPELIEDGADGLLFSPGDAPALAEKISFLLENENQRINFGLKAQRKARTEMDFRQYAEKLREQLFAASGKGKTVKKYE